MHKNVIVVNGCIMSKSTRQVISEQTLIYKDSLALITEDWLFYHKFSQ